MKSFMNHMGSLMPSKLKGPLVDEVVAQSLLQPVSKTLSPPDQIKIKYSRGPPYCPIHVFA